MTSTLRTLTTAAAAALLLTLTACAGGTTAAPTATSDGMTAAVVESACTGDEGVTVIVDGSAFGDKDDVSATWCVPSTGEIVAADALAAAKITTEGTEQYGDQVVCRVDGLPAADQAIAAADGSDYFETCKTMPAANAYWSLWVKPAGGAWDYAQEGAATQKLAPGDAVELLFTLNGAPAQPAA